MVLKYDCNMVPNYESGGSFSTLYIYIYIYIYISQPMTMKITNKMHYID